MAEYLIQGETLTRIADAIRNKVPSITHPLSPAGMAGAIDSVYDQGFNDGYDLVWDCLQDYGARKSYQSAFYGWHHSSFHPKYKVKPTEALGAQNMFFAAWITKIYKNYFDLSGMPSTADVSGMFSWCTELEHMEDIGLPAPANYGHTWNYCRNLKTIDVMRCSASTKFNSNTFMSCSALENLTVSGTIGQSGLNLQYSTKLSKASITSIINALSTTTSGLSITLSKTAVETAFPPASGTLTANIEWNTLKMTRNNWTINLL